MKYSTDPESGFAQAGRALFSSSNGQGRKLEAARDVADTETLGDILALISSSKVKTVFRKSFVANAARYQPTDIPR